MFSLVCMQVVLLLLTHVRVGAVTVSSFTALKRLWHHEVYPQTEESIVKCHFEEDRYFTMVVRHFQQILLRHSI